MGGTLADPASRANGFVRFDGGRKPFLYHPGVPRLPLMRLVLAGLVIAVLAGCGTKTVTVTQTVTTTVTKTVTTTATPPPSAAAACSGGDLSGSFSAVPGSPGAGQITYTLHLTNTSASPCYVTGLPQLQLLDANGTQLPTNVRAAQAGQATGAKIILQPGASAASDARFSPDVPGTGDQQSGACEPTASQVQVTVSGGGTLTVALSPPTAVCERGTLSMSLFAAA